MSHGNDINERAMEYLRGELSNVTDTAYVLNPEHTVAYHSMAIELPGSAGYQLRVVATNVGVAELAYGGDVEDATRQALRRLMRGMFECAQRWLDEHPEPR